MLIQLNLVVIVVMGCYLYSVVYKVILRQLDNLLCFGCKGGNKLELVTLGRVQIIQYCLKVQMTSADGYYL